MSEKRKAVLPWFKKWMKPTELQFKFLFDSIWFKDEKIPANKIEGIDSLLQAVEDKITTKRGGLSHATPIIIKTTPFTYKVPENAMLYAFECSGDALIVINKGVDVITWNTTETPIIELGLSQVRQINISSDVEVSISPILYFKTAVPIPAAPVTKLEISGVMYNYQNNSLTGTATAPAKNDIAEFGIREIEDDIQVVETLLFKGTGDANIIENWVILNQVEIN